MTPRADLCLIGCVWLYSSRSCLRPKIQLAWPTRCGPPCYPMPTPPAPTPALVPQEMIALGCSNFFGSFFKIHVICCALSVTLAVDGAGGKSQVSALPGEEDGELNSCPRESQKPASHASCFPPSSPLPSLHSTKGIYWKQVGSHTPYSQLFLLTGGKPVCVSGGDDYHAGPGVLSVSSPQGKNPAGEQRPVRLQLEQPLRIMQQMTKGCHCRALA